VARRAAKTPKFQSPKPQSESRLSMQTSIRRAGNKYE